MRVRTEIETESSAPTCGAEEQGADRKEAERGCLGSRQLSFLFPLLSPSLPALRPHEPVPHLPGKPSPFGSGYLERAPAPRHQLSTLSTQTKTEAANQSLFTHRALESDPHPAPGNATPYPSPAGVYTVF